MVSPSAKIRSRALELGFDKVGIARAERLEAEGGRLFEWLDAGYHGEMAWMDRWKEKRIDPSELLPDARSVIAVALNYFTPHEHVLSSAPTLGEVAGRGDNGSEPRRVGVAGGSEARERAYRKSGKISRYAWGDDYHDVLKEKLYALAEFIKTELPEASTKVCVDTAPMMDKVWAVRAGLGWIGKSTNLITTDFGSWVFLGEIIVDRELEYDTETVADHCGTCTACIDACPTQAIKEAYVVDARRCISYATIELRDEHLPDEIKNNLEGWIYGCDICQDVCPWNRFERPTAESSFEPRRDETSLDLDEVAEMTQEQFSERFRRSAMKRTKLTGLKRNAVALKSSGG